MVGPKGVTQTLNRPLCGLKLVGREFSAHPFFFFLTFLFESLRVNYINIILNFFYKDNNIKMRGNDENMWKENPIYSTSFVYLHTYSNNFLVIV